jgi:hypothetical protein
MVVLERREKGDGIALDLLDPDDFGTAPVAFQRRR